MIVCNNSLTLRPIFTRSDMHFENSKDSHSPLMEISGQTRTTIGNVYFKAVMNPTMPLKRVPIFIGTDEFTSKKLSTFHLRSQQHQKKSHFLKQYLYCSQF